MPLWVITLAKWLLGRLFGGNADAQVQAGAAVTKEQASNVERENAVLKEAAADRARGDAERLRNSPQAGTVNTDRNDPLNRDPDLQLRD